MKLSLGSSSIPLSSLLIISPISAKQSPNLAASLRKMVQNSKAGLTDHRQLRIGDWLCVAATHPNVDMEHRVGDLYKRRRRNACEAPMVKKVGRHLPEAGLANTHGSLQAWLPESFPGETFGVVGCQWLFIRRLHDRDLVAAAVPEVVRTSEPTVHRYGIDPVSDSLHGVPDELLHWSTASGAAQHLNWSARVALVEVFYARGEAGGGGAPVHGASREKQWGVATNGAEIDLQHKITEHERALLGGDVESEMQLPLHRGCIVLPI
ncbi:hypothetical protein OPV22_003183 [Ensete ventricosum]|uniref:Uncharacterized protein n=1 Tax=Ensete ventricosum TaxID=4639 RepID=A0AAV8S038_ENSVE|nr:hypothetical protein OPV22_003183 [Ensete ventricosum]